MEDYLNNTEIPGRYEKRKALETFCNDREDCCRCVLYERCDCDNDFEKGFIIPDNQIDEAYEFAKAWFKTDGISAKAKNKAVFKDGHTEFIESHTRFSVDSMVIDFKTVSGEYRYIDGSVPFFFKKDDRGLYGITYEIDYLEWGDEEEELEYKHEGEPIAKVTEVREENGGVTVSCIKDSGDRTEFASGAVRDMREGKGRCDLMPLDVVGYILNSPTICFIANFQKTGFPKELMDALTSSGVYHDAKTMFLEVAKHFEEGAKKYGEHNWQKGIPANCYIDSAVRHYLKWLRGDKDEPHDRAFVWNILCCIWTVKRMPGLNPYGNHTASEVEVFADDRSVKVETGVDICVCCGKPVPEGTQVCRECSEK